LRREVGVQHLRTDCGLSDRCHCAAGLASSCRSQMHTGCDLQVI
jgi:hypothetical protein